MVNQFNNLPGIYITKEDGNLRVLEAVPGDVTLILGTSPDGPVDQMFLVTDTSIAERIFDPESKKEGTLLKGMYEALEKGSRYVALYRIGATPAAVDSFGGYTILTKKANSSIANKYKLAFTNAAGVDELRVWSDAGIPVFSLTGDTITLDSGELTISKTSNVPADTTIGSISDVASCPSMIGLKDAGYYNTPNFAISGFAATGADVTFTTTTAVKAGQVLRGFTGTTGNYTAGKLFLVIYATVSAGTYSVVAKCVQYSSTGVLSEDGTPGTPTSARIAPRLIVADSGLSMTLNQKFEALARAYWELESANVDMVIPQGVFFDEENIVDNNGVMRDPATIVGDYLSKGYEFESNGQIFYAFSNSNAEDPLATILSSPYEIGLDGFAAKAWLTGKFTFETASSCSSDADIASKSQDITFGELNFGHQLATFLHGLSENQTEASGVIAMRPPRSAAKSAVAQWLGKLPDRDGEGKIIRNGTGVLGYKWRVGTTSVAPGLFATSTGFVDGTPLVDPRREKIDIGRYIDIVATPLVIRNSYDGTATGYWSPGASAYGGTIMGLALSDAPTNKTMKGDARLAISLAKKHLDALVGAGYVVFDLSTEGIVKVVDSPTGALPVSDWRRRMTCRIASGFLDETRRVCEPYIGKVTTESIRQKMEDDVNRTIETYTKNGWLNGGQATVRQSSNMAIQGTAAIRLELAIPGEMRRINIYTALTK